MRYLITTKEVKSPFLTDWFDPESKVNEAMKKIANHLQNC